MTQIGCPTVTQEQGKSREQSKGKCVVTWGALQTVSRPSAAIMAPWMDSGGSASMGFSRIRGYSAPSSALSPARRR